MKLSATNIFESAGVIVDADISAQMTAVLLKGKGECIVSINDEALFSMMVHCKDKDTYAMSSGMMYYGFTDDDLTWYFTQLDTYMRKELLNLQLIAKWHFSKISCFYMVYQIKSCPMNRRQTLHKRF